MNQKAVERTRPEVSQAQQAVDDVEGVFKMPASGIQRQDDFGREAQGVGEMGQIARPLARP